MRAFLHIHVLIACLAVFILSACGGLTVEETPVAEPLESPEDARPTPIAFNKIYFAIPTGTPIQSMSPKGVLGLLSCEWPYGLVKAKITGKSFPDDEFRKVFLDTLRTQNYDVAGDPGRMFDEDEDMMRANFSIGAKVVDVKMDLCRKTTIWGTPSGETGEASLTIEWTVYDLLRRRSVFKTETKGYANQRIANYETVDLLLEEAFAAAAHNLGANPEFHDLVFFGTQPIKDPKTDIDFDEPDITLFDPQENVTLPPLPLSTQPVKTRLEDARKTAVMIQAGQSHGSGFFISADGHIITNAHVVGFAKRVRVVLSGKKKALTAEVLRRDMVRDIALLRLESLPEKFVPPLLPIRTEKVKIGETVYAIGAPMKRRLQDTITSGIVSAHRTDRKTRLPLIQADADIHGGNSGGPLLDEFGNIIGLAVSGISIDNAGIGLNNFIPIEDGLSKLNILESQEDTGIDPPGLLP
jgi:serine protease Do